MDLRLKPTASLLLLETQIHSMHLKLAQEVSICIGLTYQKDRMLTTAHPDLFLHMVQVVPEVVLDQVERVVLPLQKMVMVNLLICMKTFLLWVMNILQDHILVRHILMLVLWMYTY